MSFSEIYCARYSSHFYLSTCDLISKKISKNFSNISMVRKIFVELSNEIPEISENSAKEPISIFDSQVESFLVLYLIKLHKPLVSVTDLRLSKKNLNTRFLKIAFSKKEDIYLFLLNFFLENLDDLVMKIQNFDSNPNRNLISREVLGIKIFAITMGLPVGSFLGLKNLFSQSIFDFRLRKLNLNIRFLFETFCFENSDVSKDSIQNVPLFWISC